MPPVILVIDTAGADARVALVDDRAGVLAAETLSGTRGLAETLPERAASVLAGGAAPDAIACVVGPGGFTGCRAGLGFAHGLALGSRIPVIGVTLGEAFRAGAGGEPVWIATAAGADRVFLDRDGVVEAVPLAALPDPHPETARVAGDAGATVAARLGLRAGSVQPPLAAIAAAARARAAGTLPPRPAAPLYVDPPRTTAAPPGAVAGRPPPGG